MPHWTEEEKRMARTGWVYYRHIMRGMNTRGYCRNLGNQHRDALVFDYYGYRNSVDAVKEY